jgi:hypothetical protein
MTEIHSLMLQIHQKLRDAPVTFTGYEEGFRQ